MASLDFSNVLKVFSESRPDKEAQEVLYKEVLVMTLSRVTSVDAHVDEAEVETVAKILCRETGEEINASQIHVASKSELFERRPIDRYLGKVREKLTCEQRLRVVECLAEVIRSDVKVRRSELRFFDRVAGALGIQAHQLAGLSADSV